MGEEQSLLAGEEIESLKTLARVAVELKRTGILDLLAELAERGEEILTSLSGDKALYRALGLADALQGGINRVEDDAFIDAKAALEELTRCSVKGLAYAYNEAKPVGLLGLLGALRDEDVKRGLGMLVAIAKGMGAACGGEEKK